MGFSEVHLLLVVVVVALTAMAEATPPGIAKNPSHATCKIKKYKHCYNLVHVCPKFCPDQCTVECVSCKPVCVGSSNPPPEDPPVTPLPPSSPPPVTYPPPSPPPSTPRPPSVPSSPPSPPYYRSPPPATSVPTPKSPPSPETMKSPPPSPTPSVPSPTPPTTPSPLTPSVPSPSPPTPSVPSPSPPMTPSPPTPSVPSPSPPTTPSVPSPSPPTTPSVPSPSPPTPSMPSPLPPMTPSVPSPSPPMTPSPPTPSVPSPSPSTTPSVPSPSPSTPSVPSPLPPMTPSVPSPSPPTLSPPTPWSAPSPPPPTPGSSPTPRPPSTTPSSPPPPTSITPSPPHGSPPASPSPSTPPSSSAGATKRVRCRNLNYPQCYNMMHTCPSACPSGCEVDCVTCKPVCKCDRPGAVCQDPRFIGGDGITFYFHGKKNRHFCLVSDPNLHINAHFIGKRNPDMKRDFTWVQSLGILFDDHQLFIGAQETAAWDDSVDRLSVAVDGQTVVIPESEGSRWRYFNGSRGIFIVRLASANNVMVEADGLFKITVKVVPITEEESRIHNYGITEENSFAHLDVGFKFLSLSSKVSGVLGQTYSSDYTSRINIQAKMAVMGRHDEFETSGLFTTGCAVAMFRGGDSGRGSDSGEEA